MFPRGGVGRAATPQLTVPPLLSAFPNYPQSQEVLKYTVGKRLAEEGCRLHSHREADF